MSEPTTEKTIQGAWRVSDIVAGRLVTRQYFNYSKRDATREFKKEAKTLEWNHALYGEVPRENQQ